MDGITSSINAILPQAFLGPASSVALKPTLSSATSSVEFSKVLNSEVAATEKASETSEADDIRAAKVKMEFEAVILSQFIGELLSSTSDVFGDGMQGDLINTVLKDAISRQVVQSGGLGISKLL